MSEENIIKLAKLAAILCKLHGPKEIFRLLSYPMEATGFDNHPQNKQKVVGWRQTEGNWNAPIQYGYLGEEIEKTIEELTRE